MTDEESAKPLKKVVGEKKSTDVWDKLYRLNTFAANLGLLHAVSDGYAPKKIVGKLRARPD